MFDVLREDVNDVDLVRILNRESGERICIAPGFGGNVCEIVFAAGGRTHSVLDGYTTGAEFIENAGFKSAKLIPFPNRIKDGKYFFNGTDYQLPINRKKENHAIHGFFYNRPMEVERRSGGESEGSVILSSLYGGDIPGYPFELKVQIKYSLHEKSGFSCTTQIENFGRKPAPIGDGWHPYFSLGEKVGRLMLKIPAKFRTEVDDRMIPTGKRFPADDFKSPAAIGDAQLDTGFMLSEDDGVAVTELYCPKENLTLEIWQETGRGKYNYLQVYIPPSRSSIAIEPMTCNIDAFNNTDGLIMLGPEERFEAS